MENMIPTVAAAAVGMAIGGAAVYAATQDHRQIRRTVHRLSRGAEKALIDFDRIVESYTKSQKCTAYDGGALHKKANKMPQRNPMPRCGRPKPLYFNGNTA